MIKLKIKFLRIIVVQFILILVIVFNSCGNGKIKAPITGISTKTLNFSGLSWQIRSGTGNPGGNNWSDSSESVWVDENGILHMTIRKINGVWNCSEIYTDANVGYGEYRFYVASNVENLDKNVVVGLFTYLDDKNEIDIEFSKWGNAAEEKMGTYATQPTKTLGNSHNFELNLNGSYSTHRFIWKSDRIGYKSWHGHERVSSENSFIQEWEYLGNDIPIPGDEKLIINLWLYQGNVPNDGNEVEVLIKSVKVYKPPVINNSIVSVTEDIPFYTVIDTLHTPGYTAPELEFSVIEGNEMGLFSVSEDGAIILEKKIDYEESDEHLLKILAVKGDMSDTATVQINVINVNDNPPLAKDTTFTISEDFQVDSIIGKLDCIDLDGDSLTYEITDGNAQNQYFVSPDGNIILKQKLDYESNTSDTLNIKISDGEFISEATVHIIISNVVELGFVQPPFTNKILIYPNPVRVELNIDLIPFMDFEILILGMDGKTFLVNEITRTDNFLKLDVRDLIPGFYLIMIKSGYKSYALKFEKL